MMDEFAGIVDTDMPLRKAIEVFDKTRFAFVPIIAEEDDDSESNTEVKNQRMPLHHKVVSC